ncbi:chaperone [Kockovaella imperatae]|uniref:Chaperone n=1 Tax=Kockovaella imperatae TaxID=4999 RepID=A0A1Y1UFS7_9TREE|nr:chaperone [Kockovaella imperatae]ORX36911.1 chaperone [Kockovaella imperatae]
MSDAAAIKAEANKAFAAKNYTEASKLYSDAIALDPSNHVLFSNRSASKAGLRDYQGALEDAEKCIELNPDFSKGYARKGAAYHGLRQYPEAVMAYDSGLEKDPSSDVLKKGLADVKKAMDSDPGSPFGPGGDMGLGKLFKDPALISKLESHPKTSSMMKDPTFRTRVMALQSGTKGAEIQVMMADPRMLTVLGVAMGIDIDAMERPEGSHEMPPGMGGSSAGATRSFPSEPPSSSSAPSHPAPEQPKPKEPEPEPEAMEVDSTEADGKKEAEELKAKGNTAYKARKFDEAIELYQKAWEVYPKDITYLSNLSAVYFEQGDYDKCLETCEKAIEEAHEIRIDFKMYAKIYARMGSAYTKKEDLDNAIKYLGKSLTEHRTPDVLTKLRAAEKAKVEKEKAAYVDPEKAEAAKQEGNAAFKAGKWPEAVSHYTEAIKRNPTQANLYTNRSSAYTKLLALPEALKDADAAIKLDPNFVKAYIRKGLTQQAMKDHSGALETFQLATEKDTAKAHTREIETNMAKVVMEMESQRAGETDEQTFERAMRDPEIAEIMSDPVMRQILQDSQTNPKALQDHMKNPLIAKKVQKLVNAGIIRTR